MNIISVFFMLTFGVLMPNQYRYVQANDDIGGFQFELLLTHLADFQSVMEDRYDSSLSQMTSILERLEAKVVTLESRMENLIKSSTSQIITIINQNEAKVDGMESRMAHRITNSSSQIINTFDRQIKESESNVAKRIETSSSQVVDMMQKLDAKIDVLESRTKDRYDNSSLIAERLEEKVDVVIMKQSPWIRFANYVLNLNMSILSTPWTTVQQRFDGSIDFFRDWNAYKNGFGHQPAEFWIGLQQLYKMTNSGTYELLIVLEDFNGKIVHALYDDFQIGNEAENYVLKKLGTYSGTAGNSLQRHIGMAFSTKDKDNDGRNFQNCASDLQGGWWFMSGGDCIHCHLNGQYYQQPNVQKMQGLNWYGFHGDYYSLKSTKMMIRRKNRITDYDYFEEEY